MKLSIITINRNNAEGLRMTMESVLKQMYLDIEYIIVDGASTDGSVEVIQNYVRQIDDRCIDDRLTSNKGKISVIWLSEPDKGIYEAMNKGVRMAHGEYVLMLNSGDWLVDEHVIERILPELDGTDIIQGNTIEEFNGGKSRNRGYGKSEIDLFDILKGHFLHQASFCRRELFDRYGYFDESYRICADTKFFLFCLGRKDASFKYIDIDVANYDMTGISADKSGKWAICREEELGRLRKEVFSDRIFSFMLDNDKKVRLYNDLHAHKWIWNLTMAVAHINNCFYKK